ncbi:MAG: DUF721 domain-containing protein [Chitinivibrionales bacterium]|nr:DUF721 domain-containing protein [Chitinivibrionales bacterium]MBD3394000.1 DUF721 domain-containing protein [Chitinivibrionales bacterium]
MTSRKEPQKLGSILEGVLSQRGYLSVCREGQIRERWTQIVGERVAAVSECRGVENGILYVRVPSAAWRQEISFLKQRILSRIRTETQCRTVKDIVFC